MQKTFFLFLFIILLFSPQVVSAHLPGQDPFLKVNGTFTKTYSILSTSLPDFPLPHGEAPTVYLPGEHLVLELDTKTLPISEEDLKTTTIRWDMGDGRKAEGLRVEHRYTTIGSYLVNIFFENSKTKTPQVLESMVIHIVPQKDYQLPKAKITVNKKTTNDPLTDVLSFTFGEPLTFDATDSNAPSSTIASYFWDLGDGATSTKPNVTHVYKKGIPLVFPFVRVTDTNGFFVDTYVQINNTLYENQKDVFGKETIENTPPQTSSQLPFVSMGLLFLIGAGIVWKKLKKKEIEKT